MTEREKAEITRRARMDAQALRSGWPVKVCPYHTQDAADLWQEVFDKALKQGAKNGF